MGTSISLRTGRPRPGQGHPRPIQAHPRPIHGHPGPTQAHPRSHPKPTQTTIQDQSTTNQDSYGQTTIQDQSTTNQDSYGQPNRTGRKATLQNRSTTIQPDPSYSHLSIIEITSRRAPPSLGHHGITSRRAPLFGAPRINSDSQEHNVVEHRSNDPLQQDAQPPKPENPGVVIDDKGQDTPDPRAE